MPFLSSRCCTAIGFALSLTAVGMGPRPAVADPGGEPLPPGVIARLGQPPVQHNRVITCLALAPDGKTLLSGSEDGTAILWDLKGK